MADFLQYSFLKKNREISFQKKQSTKNQKINFMKKQIFSILTITAMSLVSCDGTPKTEAVTPSEPTEVVAPAVTPEAGIPTVDGTGDATVSTTDKNGNKLNIRYIKDNTVVVLFAGDSIELKRAVSASGELYKNEQYELWNKGKQYTFEKDGKVIFEN
ncbi:MAG: hypothetical protein C4K58_03965 [Flavobacteriaceae bacterium]|nr:MAG: hypothetical protein C4K58_03965 [Flavobacteriaceae bacterium]